MIIPVELTVFEDRSFTFITKTPPAADYAAQGCWSRQRLGRAEPVESCDGQARQSKGNCDDENADLNANDVEAAMRMVEGTARSMGITIED